jgi:hypothetical protein
MARGRECVEYWSRQKPSVWHAIKPNRVTQRLQLGTVSRTRPGFHRPSSQAITSVTREVQELEQLASLPDNSYHEILVLGAFFMQAEELVRWLYHCDRVLIANGTLVITCTPEWRQSATRIVADSPLASWDMTWETAPDSIVAILLKPPVAD